MRTYRQLLLIVATVFYCVISYADVMTQPPTSAQATVAVTDRSATALQLGLQNAFSEVMQHMSNDPAIMQKTAIHNASAHVTQWVQSYAYVAQPNVNPHMPPTLTLHVIFDTAGLQQLLNAANHKAKMPTPTTPIKAGVITLVVTGIQNINDYVEIMRALRAMNNVNHVATRNVATDRVTLEVTFTETPEQFQQAMSQSGKFKLDTAEDKLQHHPAVLQYIWVEK